MKTKTRIEKGISPFASSNSVKTVRLRSKINQVIVYNDSFNHRKAINGEVKAVWSNTSGEMRGKVRLFKHSEPVEVTYSPTFNMWFTKGVIGL